MTYDIEVIDRFIGSDEPDSAATYSRYRLTTDHAASSYGIPVLVGPTGIAYGPADRLPCGELAGMYLFAFCLRKSTGLLAAVNKFNAVAG